MSSILFEQQGNLGFIRLNRPEKFNAFNREMAFGLQQVLDECSANESIRAIYLTGMGKAFSAGQDLSELTGSNPVGIDKILSEHYNPIVLRMRNISKPILCAVNGVAAGAGANIALCADIVLASEQASFIQAFSKIGLIPDSSGTFFLPRLIGFQKASALMMTGDKVTAMDAEKMGMLYKVYPAEKFEEESIKLAFLISEMPTHGLALTKQALNQSMQHNLEQQLQLEDVLQRQAADTADYREGVAAFMEKRTPLFNGK